MRYLSLSLSLLLTSVMWGQSGTGSGVPNEIPVEVLPDCTINDDFSLDVETFSDAQVWGDCSVIAAVATVNYPFDGSEGEVDVCFEFPTSAQDVENITVYEAGDFQEIVGGALTPGYARYCATVSYPTFDPDPDIGLKGFEDLSFYYYYTGGNVLLPGILKGTSADLITASGECTVPNALNSGFEARAPLTSGNDEAYYLGGEQNLSDLIGGTTVAGHLFEAPELSGQMPRNIIFEGTLNIDVDYNYGVIGDNDLSSLTLINGSSINVKDGVTFNVNNTQIQGCLTLWESINVEDGGTLNIRNSIVSGGERAINVQSDGKLFVEATEFKNNHIGISTPNDPNDDYRNDVDIVVAGSGFDFRSGTGLRREDPLHRPDPILLRPRFGEIPFAGAEFNDTKSGIVFTNGSSIFTTLQTASFLTTVQVA